MLRYALICGNIALTCEYALKCKIKSYPFIKLNEIFKYT